jgi:SAM-dependent methyltransferase
LFVFHMRESRVKAKVPAVLEALSLWRPFEPVAPISGPLAEMRGVFWIALGPRYVGTATQLLPRLGYSFAVDQIQERSSLESVDSKQANETSIRWRGGQYDLIRVYEENRERFRQRAVDQRVFLLENSAGDVEAIRGYRGDGSDLHRRGLPVEDARLLVNLVSPKTSIGKDMVFLEPFAGTGGIVIEALEAGYEVVSADLDKRLRHGLKALGAVHLQADATRLPCVDNVFTAIATEPPYHGVSQPMLLTTFDELYRVLRSGGRISMLVAQWQVKSLLEHSAARKIKVLLASQVDRKGTPAAVLVWEK